jgi:site-specific recombinase XerD
MSGNRSQRWQQMDHSQEPLLTYLGSAKSTTASPGGPIAEFLAKKAAERAPKTHEWYRDSLMQLWHFLEERDLGRIGDFTEHAVNLFRIHLRERGASGNTVSNRLRAIKAFARWMAERGWSDENVLRGLRVPQSTKPSFDLISDDVRTELFALFDPDTFLGSRNLGILAILSDTGLRREEVANLLLKNLDLEAQTLKVFSDKSDDWRYVPLTDEAVSLIRNHLKWRGRYFSESARHRMDGSESHRSRQPRHIQSDRLFLTWDGRQLRPQALGLILERASKKLGRRIHPHLFRHDWITRKALDGENPSIVKRWAGHRSFAMTDFYFDLAEEMLGAIKPKRSVLTAVALPGMRRRGRPPKTAAK